MKASKFLACCFVLTTFLTSAFASDVDSIRMDEMQHSIESLKGEISVLNTTVLELSKAQTRNNDAVVNLKAADQRNSTSIDTLFAKLNVINENLQETANKLGIKIKDTNDILGEKADSKAVQQRTIYGSVFFALITIICALIYVLLRRRIIKGSVDIAELQKKAEKLNEEIVGNFAAEMAEMQKISASLSAINKNNGGQEKSEQDHSLIKTLADRITFMEMTLSKMDASVRGYKQLAKSISQMKDNLKVNGYELVDMLGKIYKEGMNVTATFVDDENIEAGKQIITGIIKPQINYNGVMIQAAQITVSQNV